MKYKIAIFDLDGTLVDSLAAIAMAANSACKELGLKTYDLIQAKTLIGHGILGIANRIAINEGLEDQKDKIVKTVRKYYDIYWNYDLKLYPGISDMLDKFTNMGIKLAIATNKDQKYTDETVQSLLKKWNFVKAIGASDNIPRKPDPYAIEQILKISALPKDQAIYFGDMKVDINTGKNAGVFMTFCNWGFGQTDDQDPPDLIIKHPMDIFDHI